ncbi:MAG TPA: flagellar protein FlaG [Alcaligenaceae bacterium]|nr:flagellar protein FlaG [Alcaligenaceae bacterium]
MVNPVASQALPTLTPGTQPDVDTQSHKQDAAVQVQPSAESRSQSHEYQRWPHRPPMGDLIEPEKSSLDTTLEQINESMRAWATGLRFDVDEDTQKLIVSLVDSDTGEIIRAVPSDAALQISKMIAKFQGNSINTKA